VFSKHALRAKNAFLFLLKFYYQPNMLLPLMDPTKPRVLGFPIQAYKPKKMTLK